MSRTKRYDPKRNLEIDDGDSNFIQYKKEEKAARKERNRGLRHDTKRLVKSEDLEETPLPKYQGTGGWDTW